LVSKELKLSRQLSGEPEIFHSLQGEGHSIGTPTVFLRLALCNLTCVWCDTKYTWDWANFDPKTEILPLTSEDIEERILRYDCPHLVITGGEPMMQQDALAPLALSLKGRGFYIEVETNGTLAPNADMEQAVSQWNVSPKLANSGVDADKREIAESLTAFAASEKSYFKFVLSQPTDVDEVLTLVERYAIQPQRVILMPQGTTRKAIEEGSQWVTDLCTKHGFRFSSRMHILLWGDKRGR
jgi:7-carboxy-7-deazaguanine synthase